MNGRRPRPEVDINDDRHASDYTVDGLFQGDTVTNLRTGQTGTVTFASAGHVAHVNVHGLPAGAHGHPHTEIWPTRDIAEALAAIRGQQARTRACPGHVPCEQYGPHLGSSVKSADGSWRVYGHCADCNGDIHRVVRPGQPEKPWQLDAAPPGNIPVPEPRRQMSGQRSVYDGLDEAACCLARAAQRPGIEIKQQVLYSLSQGLESVSRAVRQIADSLLQAGYGPEATDPVYAAGSSVLSAMTAAEQAMHAVGSLADLKLRDAAASGRQIPHHSELNGAI